MSSETYQDLEKRAAENEMQWDLIFQKLDKFERDLLQLHEAILFLCGSIQARVKEGEVSYNKEADPACNLQFIEEQCL